MRIYTDTSGLFAAIVRNDLKHANAKATLTALLESGSELHATSYVLLETLALLQTRVGLEAAAQCEFVFRPLLQVTWITEELHERSFRRLKLKRSRGVSLVDCSSFVVMEDLEIRSVFGYDEDFAKEGFHLVGTPKELSVEQP